MKTFTHTYVFIAITEHLPSVKLESDNLQNACTYFLLNFTQREKAFDVDEGKEPNSATLKVHPNPKLIRMLKLDMDKPYTFTVIEQERLKQISPEFL